MTRDTIKFRITVLQPPVGVQFRLQEGRSDLVLPSRTTPDSLEFEFDLRLGAPRGGQPNFLGPAAQGPADARFVYVNSGRRAGQLGTAWDRRAKIPLCGIPMELVNAALADDHALLEARIAGTGPDGGPVCATVRLLEEWGLVESAPG